MQGDIKHLDELVQSFHDDVLDKNRRRLEQESFAPINSFPNLNGLVVTPRTLPNPNYYYGNLGYSTSVLNGKNERKSEMIYTLQASLLTSNQTHEIDRHLRSKRAYW